MKGFLTVLETIVLLLGLELQSASPYPSVLEFLLSAVNQSSQEQKKVALDS